MPWPIPTAHLYCGCGGTRTRAHFSHLHARCTILRVFHSLVTAAEIEPALMVVACPLLRLRVFRCLVALLPCAPWADSNRRSCEAFQTYPLNVGSPSMSLFPYWLPIYQLSRLPLTGYLTTVGISFWLLPFLRALPKVKMANRPLLPPPALFPAMQPLVVRSRFPRHPLHSHALRQSQWSPLAAPAFLQPVLSFVPPSQLL